MIVDLTARSALWIPEGSARLTVDLTAEVAVGSRMVHVPLGRIGCGLLPAVDGAAAAVGVRLSARLAQGVARPVAWDSREAADAVTPEVADGWAGGFGRMLSALVATGPRVDAAIAPGEIRRIAAPQSLGSRRGIGWLIADRPCLAGFGIGTARGALAVTPQAWAQATGEGTVRAAAARFLWAEGGLPDALAATQEAWLAALPALVALAEVDRHQGRRGRQVRAATLLAAAERRATGTLPGDSPDKGRRSEEGGRQLDFPVEEPALAVAAELAHRLNLPLRIPPKRLRRTADQPYSLNELALASGFRLRRVATTELALGSHPMPLAVERRGTVNLLTGKVPPLENGSVLWAPVRPLGAARLTPRALLPLLRHGRNVVRDALLDRVMRLPAARIRESEAGGWVAWLDRLEGEAAGLSSELTRLGAAGTVAVAAVALLAGLCGWPAALAAAGAGLLAAAGETGRPARPDRLDPSLLAALERLPKIRSLAARHWILLSWYQAQPAGSRQTLFHRSALRSAALGAAPLLGAACAPATPWLAAAATSLAALTGGIAVAAGIRLAGALRSPGFPGVPAGRFDLDPAETPQRSDPGDLAGQIVAVGLSVRRPDEERWLLADLDLSIAPGEFVALVGPSGCGKTTLLSILLGQRQPTVGAVFYDGYDLRSLEPAVLGRTVAAVGQRDRLRPGTVREMLDCGHGHAEDRLWAGLAAVGLHDMVAELPRRLDTRLALGQASLSRGQVQLLLLARALLAPASILILDEPTSALDGMARAQAVRAIRRSPATRIVATHCDTVIRAADRIIDLTAAGHGRLR